MPTAGDDGGTAGSCGVNLINEGMLVTGDCVRIQFTGCGSVQSYQCKMDKEPFKTCEFMYRLQTEGKGVSVHLFN